MLKTVYRSSRRDKHNFQWRDSNLYPLTPQSDALTTRPQCAGIFWLIMSHLMLWQQPVEDALHRLHADIFWLIISHLMLWLQQVEMTTICRYFLVDSEPFDAVVQPVGNLMLSCNK